MRYKIIIEKYFEDDIEAKTEDEAVDIAWDRWLQNDEVDISIEKIEERD